jgi:hypothetical protein
MKPKLQSRLGIARQVKQAIRHPYAWPGGYPLSIIMRDGAAICPACAKQEWRQIAHDTIRAGWEQTGWSAVGVDILWEGGNTCDHCGANLDAYPEN